MQDVDRKISVKPSTTEISTKSHQYSVCRQENIFFLMVRHFKCLLQLVMLSLPHIPNYFPYKMNPGNSNHSFLKGIINIHGYTGILQDRDVILGGDCTRQL